MRRLVAPLAAMVLVCALPVAAGAQSTNRSIQGFGGLTFDSSSIVGTSTATTFGGVVTAGLTPNIQIIGEVGRMSDIKPPLLDLLDLTPVGLRVSALYGAAGVRLIASPRSAVRPYAEATAGFARLSPGLSGFGGRTDAILDTGLSLLNRTEPLVGAGGGIVLQGGPIALDIGYRYKRILASGVSAALNGGNPFGVNDVRIGLGISF